MNSPVNPTATRRQELGGEDRGNGHPAGGAGGGGLSSTQVFIQPHEVFKNLDTDDTYKSDILVNFASSF